MRSLSFVVAFLLAAVGTNAMKMEKTHNKQSFLRADSTALVKTESRSKIETGNKYYVCTQVDLAMLNKVVQVSFAVSGELELTTAPAQQYNIVKLSAFIGGGLSLDAIVIKGSGYMQGQVDMEFPVSKLVTDIKGILAIGVSYIYRFFNRYKPLGTFLRASKSLFAQSLRRLKKEKNPEKDTVTDEIAENTVDKFKKAKKEINSLIYHTESYTPWECRNRHLHSTEKHVIPDPPAKLPDHPSCKYNNKDGAFVGKVGENYLLCPRHIPGPADYKFCDYVCPSKREVIKAFDVPNPFDLNPTVTDTTIKREKLPPCKEFTTEEEVKAERVAKLEAKKEKEKAERGYFWSSFYSLISWKKESKNPFECVLTSDDAIDGCKWTATEKEKNIAYTNAAYTRENARTHLGLFFQSLKTRGHDLSTALKEQKETEYVDIILSLFNQVYIPDAPVHTATVGVLDKITNAFRKSKTGGGEKKKITSETLCGSDLIFKTKAGLDPMRPLICMWVTSGFMLPEGAKDKIDDTIRDSVYALFPALISKPGGEFNFANSQKALDELLKTDENSFLTFPAITSDDEKTKTAVPGALYTLYDVSMLLSIPLETFDAEIQARLDEEAKRIADKEITENKQEWCEAHKITGSITFGITVGGSTVGFCTPDTNPLQISASASYQWGYEYVVQGDQCNPKTSKPDSTATGVFAAGIFFQFALTHSQSENGGADTRGIKFSFRLPLKDGSGFLAKQEEENANAHAITAKITPLFEDWRAGKEPFADFEAKAKDVLTGVIQAANDLRSKSRFLEKFADAFGGTIKGFENNLKQSFLKLTAGIASHIGPTVELADEELIGIDIEKTFGKQGFTIQFVKHTYSVLSGSIPLHNVNMEVAVTGSFGVENTVKIA